MFGAIVNCFAVILGGLVGVIVKKGLPERVSKTIMSGLALCVMLIGLKGVFKSNDILFTIIAVALGGFIGESIDLDKHLNNLGHALEKKFSKGDSPVSIAQAFVTSSLLFCVGAMSVVGALQSGLTGNHETLFAKSVIDGIAALILATTLGFGVALSGFALLIYEGGIALSASLIEPILTETVINNMTCIGSLLIIALSLNMLNCAKIKVINLVPAIFIPLLYGFVQSMLF